MTLTPILLISAALGCATADAVTTLRPRTPGVYEANPLYPGRVAFVGLKIGFGAGSVYAVRQAWKTPTTRGAKIGLASVVGGVAAVQCWAGWHNSRVQARARRGP